MSTKHYSPSYPSYLFNKESFSFELKSPVEQSRPQWKVEEELPFSMCDDYETERRRRLLGINAFRKIEEEERNRRLEDLRKEQPEAQTAFSPSLVYTVIEEEMERQRRIDEIENEPYEERARSSRITTKAEEQERAARIKNLFQEETIQRRKNSAYTRELEEKERRRRMNDYVVESEKRNLALTTSRIVLPRIQSVLRNKSLRKTDKSRELKFNESNQRIVRAMTEERSRRFDKTRNLEEEERNRRIKEGEMNKFKAKEVSKVLIKEALQSDLFKRISKRNVQK